MVMVLKVEVCADLAVRVGVLSDLAVRTSRGEVGNTGVKAIGG